VREASEGHEVVFTERGEGDVANENHLVVARFEGNAQVRSGVLISTIEEFHVHVRHPSRGVSQTVACGIITERGEELGDKHRHSFAVNHG